MLGVDLTQTDRVVEVGDWLIDPDAWQEWRTRLRATVAELDARPLEPPMSADAALRVLDLPARELVSPLAAAAELMLVDGRISLPSGKTDDLGPAESGLRQLETRLADQPFLAPERPDLDAWGLGSRELAAAERLGRIVRLTPDVVLLPTGPARAMRLLAGLPQPFTTSAARLALGTTRRVAIPLLEHLDRRGWTVRVDDQRRRVKGR